MANTPITPIRLAAELLDRAQQTIDRRNAHRPKARPWTLSEFIRTVLEREMRKMARSRRPRGSRITTPRPRGDQSS